MAILHYTHNPYLTHTLGVAVSGGVDSMVLLHSLVEAGANVVVLSVEHGIRGEDSVADFEFVQAYAEQKGLSFEGVCVDAPARAKATGEGLESAARALRYAFFESVLSSGRVDYVLTAHHRDDLCETVVMNLLRGSGIVGMIGIADRDRYLRPLLSYSHADLVAYAEEHNVPYRTDLSNEDQQYRRNWVRHTLLPTVESGYPAYREALARLSEVAKEQVALLDSLAIAPTVDADGNVRLPIDALRQPTALAKYSLHLALSHMGADYTAAHYEALMGLLDAPAGARLDLPHAEAWVEYGDLLFCPKTESLSLDVPFSPGVYAGYEIRPWQEGDRLRFDLDKIPIGSRIRLRKKGDRFAKFGGGTKSLGDYYTDAKYPLRLRDCTPIVAIGQDVLLTPIEISRSIAVDEHSTKIYTYCREKNL
ncbi:MAG: tRNA lysidine(34) synthetase TilS [Clostridia bacterium]|nr:tRNA lysidine(34) synthetase TilS [Clostridia bacterium]